MFNDYNRNESERLNTGYYDRDDLGTGGNGLYYAIGALVLIVAVIGAFIYAGPPREELATAPARSQETTLPAPAKPATPGLPSAAPGAAPLAPSPAPQE